MRAWFAIPLWQRVIAALILGIATGLIWGPGAESIKIVGDIFIAFIKMLVVPLIFFSLVAGVASIGDLRKLGSVGWRAMLLFVATTAATILVTILTSWLGAASEQLVWLPGAWSFVMWLLMWVVLPLVHFGLQVESDRPALLSVASGAASWLVGAAFTTYWHAVT